MIGTKKLSAIRREIETALASTGEDPIQRLERRFGAVDEPTARLLAEQPAFALELQARIGDADRERERCADSRLGATP